MHITYMHGNNLCPSSSQLKKKSRTATDRVVYQYHYTNWPDHGIPENPLPILSFVRKSAAANPEGAGPIVVHCRSAVM